MPQTSPKEETDSRLETRVLHERVLSDVFSRVQSAKDGIVRSDLESAVCHSYPTSLTNSKASHVAEVVRTTINVLLGFGALIEGDAGSNKVLKLDAAQAHCLENVDHYLHALFLFEEANAQLLAEEVSLLQQLIERVKTSRASSASGGNRGSISGAQKGKGGKPNGNSRNKKRKSDEGVVEVSTSEDMDGTHILALPEDTLPVRINNIEHQTSKEMAIQRVRTLQLMLHRQGIKPAIESTLAAHHDKPKFNPTALGPLGFPEMTTAARESRGPSMSPRTVSSGTQSNVLNGAESKPTSELASSLKPGYEIDLKTQPLDFMELAAQFEPWNGQESDAGIPGRSSPRPTPSPGADHVNSVSPSPPPLGLPQAACVLIPRFVKLNADDIEKELDQEKKKALNEEELQEEHGLADSELLARHNNALDEFRIKYEREQEQQKKSRRETREAGEKAARIVVAAAARARSHSAGTSRPTHKS